jgi:hypothetical protein
VSGRATEHYIVAGDYLESKCCCGAWVPSDAASVFEHLSPKGNMRENEKRSGSEEQ